jgi:AhpC/TSA family/Disulphide bond corrector protein DsbC
MTQLVELQHVLPELEAAGYQPYAISNDTVERLAAFAQRNHITFSLLSDEDSTIIRRYGILNTLIEPGEGKEMRWYGIPYPGTYITDATGVIVQKDFHQHHARRASGRMLVHQVTGTVPDADDDTVQVRDTIEGPQLALDAYLLDDALRLEVLSTLVCRIRVADDFHLYADGAPDAFTAARLTVQGAGIRVGDAHWPTPKLLDMPLVGGIVPIWDGEVTVTVPITATSEIIRLGHGLEQSEAIIDVRLDYQACNDDTCLFAQSVDARLTTSLATLIEPDGIKTYVERRAPE